MNKKPLSLPQEEPVLRVLPRFYDTNQRGDIFGGWLMSQIDLAGSLRAQKAAQGPVATIAVKEMLFQAPLFVGDVVSFYAEVIKVGRKSITVEVEVYAERRQEVFPSESGELVKAARAIFVYVAVSSPGKSRLIPTSTEPDAI